MVVIDLTFKLNQIGWFEIYGLVFTILQLSVWLGARNWPYIPN